MRTRIVLLSVLALAACQTVPIVKTADGAFDIRYDRLHHGSLDADVAANRHCGYRSSATLVSDTTHTDTFKYRNYRCTPVARRR
jgi:hypothetical protein